MSPELVLLYEPSGAPPPPPPTLPAGIEPKTVHCGEVLKEHTLVANDLIDCPGEGLVVGAPNIVVDLGGHIIDGPDYLLGNITGQEEGFPAGIRVSGHDNVIVRNGTVQEFGWGVLLTAGTTRAVVEDLTVLRNATSRASSCSTPTTAASATRSATTGSPGTSSASISSWAPRTASSRTTRSTATSASRSSSSTRAAT